MAGVVRYISDLERKGVDLFVKCQDCDHSRTISVARVVAMFRARGWSDDWYGAVKRFRCRECGSKNVHLDADFYGHALRRQRRAKLEAVPETLRPGLRPPPPGISISEWNVATERERKRLVDRSRS